MRRAVGDRSPGAGARVDIVWRLARRPLSNARVRQLVHAAALVGGGRQPWFEIVFVGDPELARLHAKWLGDPSVTDVMAFDLSQDPTGPAGQVVVSVTRARAAARERSREVADELSLYVVHGVLHLCGYDDTDRRKRARMRVAEAKVLDRLSRVRSHSS